MGTVGKCPLLFGGVSRGALLRCVRRGSLNPSLLSLQGNARGLAHCQAKKCQQPPEEVKELIRQARYASTVPARLW
jgi:hypothetical protein